LFPLPLALFLLKGADTTVVQGTAGDIRQGKRGNSADPHKDD